MHWIAVRIAHDSNTFKWYIDGLWLIWYYCFGNGSCIDVIGQKNKGMYNYENDV